MIHTINHMLTGVFDVVLYPFALLGEFWEVLFLSVLMSYAVLWIYKWVSSPQAVKHAKNQIKASILGIRLYKDLWKVILLSFGRSLFYTFKYFLLNFGPVLLIIPILFPAFVQMDVRYGQRPFAVGDEVVVTARFVNGPNAVGINDMNIRLQDNEHFEPAMNPVFVKALGEVNWKLKVLRPGTTTLDIKVNDRVFSKRLVIGPHSGALNNKKMNISSVDHFIYPAEGLLPGQGEIEQISIRYPGKEIHFAGISGHWLVFNLILVLVVVLALKNRFGIEF